MMKKNIIILLVSCFVMQAEAVQLNESRMKGFQQGSDNTLIAKVEASSNELTATALFQEQYVPGWYKFIVEYQTSGLASMETFRMDLKGNLIRQPLQQVSSASSWVPLVLYFNVKEKSAIGLRCIITNSKHKEIEIKFRNIRIETFKVKSGHNLLFNSDFSMGQPEDVPPGWFWKYNGTAGDYALIKDSSFKYGKQVMSIKCDGKKPRTLSSFKMPLPETGEINFKIWGKTASSNMMIKIFILGDHFKWHAKKIFRLSDKWSKVSVNLKCPKQSKSPFFWVRVDVIGSGNVRLAGGKLLWTNYPPKNDFKKNHDAINRLPDRKNLIKNSGFELGMNNWMLDFFAPKSCEMSTAISNSAECKIIPGIGIDGSSAFFLDNSSLISGCIPLREKQKYTLSVYVKATKKNSTFRLFILDPGWKCYKKKIKNLPVGKWIRLNLTCVWKKYSKQKKLYVRFNGKSILLDRIQLEQGELTDYQAPQMESGFITYSDNIFIQDKEPAKIKLKISSVSTKKQKLKIKLTIRDAWNKLLWNKNIIINHSLTTVQPVELFDCKLGVFNLEAKIYDSKDKLISDSKSRYAIIKELSPDSRELPLFGICYEIPYLPKWLIKDNMPLIRMMGAGTNRFFLKNKYWTSSSLPESYIQSLKQRTEIERVEGIKNSIACFNDIPVEIRDRILNNELVDDVTLKLYGKYLKAIVAPLQKQIKYWEICNEPNLWRFRKGPRKGEKTMPPAKYIQLLKTSYQLIKSINLKLQVVGVCLNNIDFSYLEEVMKLGAGKYMDAFSFHSYRASPDLPDLYVDLVKFRSILDKYDFHGPIINTEQYYAANKFIMHGSDEESRRYYYLPDNEELRSCARTVRNYINHVAVGASYFAYSPHLTLFRYGGFDRYYLFYAFGAYNAASRFLNTAGKGHPLKGGDALKVLIFPNAIEGPLMTINTIDPKAQGALKMNGFKAAYDMMGNQYSELEIKKGLPVCSVPIYIRFKKGSNEKQIIQSLTKADIRGLGDAFKIDFTLTSHNIISLTVSNCLNKSISGKAVIPELPRAWKLKQNSIAFNNLKPSESINIDFYGDFVTDSSSTYQIVAMISAGDDIFVKKTFNISPVWISKLDKFKVDGNLKEWKNIKWIELGKKNLSKNFNPRLAYNGSEDLSARIGIGWSKNYFAVAVEVRDDVISNPKAASHAYGADSLQIYFDQLNNAKDSDYRYDSDDIVYAVSLTDSKPKVWLERACESRYIGEANKSSGYDLDVNAAIIRTAGKTIYEIKFPRHCLPLVKFSKGETIGFAILINDNDGKGRKIGLTMTPKGTEPHEKPYLYRDLYFK